MWPSAESFASQGNREYFTGKREGIREKTGGETGIHSYGKLKQKALPPSVSMSEFALKASRAIQARMPALRCYYSCRCFTSILATVSIIKLSPPLGISKALKSWSRWLSWALKALRFTFKEDILLVFFFFSYFPPCHWFLLYFFVGGGFFGGGVVRIL